MESFIYRGYEIELIPPLKINDGKQYPWEATIQFKGQPIMHEIRAWDSEELENEVKAFIDSLINTQSKPANHA